MQVQAGSQARLSFDMQRPRANAFVQGSAVRSITTSVSFPRDTWERSKAPAIVRPVAPRPETNGSADPGDQLVRIFDIVVALAAIVALIPVMLALMVCVRLSSPGPAIFRQQRVGRSGKLFPCLKFRSMVVDAQDRLDALLSSSAEARAEWDRDQKLRVDPRITPVGRFLRKTSLDELPQLFNILAGQMSIVGPRPIIEQEIVRYGPMFEHYCSVRPGLTGLWQISGRNDMSYSNRVRLDAFYARRKSLRFDFLICVRTIPAIVSSRGCY